MIKRRTVLCIALMFLSLPMKASEVIDRIVAVVDRSIISLSDVRLGAELSSLSPSPFPPFQARREDSLQFLIEVRVLRRLAGDVPLYMPTDDEIQSRLLLIKDSWDSRLDYNKFLEKHGLDEAKLRAALKTLMVAERYAVRSVGVVPGEDSKQLKQRYELWINKLLSSANYRLIEEKLSGVEDNR